MASRRMFALTIIDSDAFLDMPLSAQALYFHLSMRADDDGFVNNPKKIQRMIGATEDDCKILILKRFILTFESGVIVIKHWKIHNYIQKDRYKPTIYKDEKSLIIEKDNKVYTECIQAVSNQDSQASEVEEKKEIEENSGSSSIENDQLQLFRGHIMLSENQLADLLDKLGLEAFEYYIDRLNNFIEETGANIKSHYETILKWNDQDSKTKKII